MSRRARLRVPAGVIAALVLALTFGLGAQSATAPVRLTDREFWKLVNDLSETNGSFQSENLISNETRLQYVIPQLEASVPPGKALN